MKCTAPRRWDAIPTLSSKLLCSFFCGQMWCWLEMRSGVYGSDWEIPIPRSPNFPSLWAQKSLGRHSAWTEPAIDKLARLGCCLSPPHPVSSPTRGILPDLPLVKAITTTAVLDWIFACATIRGTCSSCIISSLKQNYEVHKPIPTFQGRKQASRGRGICQTPSLWTAESEFYLGNSNSMTLQIELFN